MKKRHINALANCIIAANVHGCKFTEEQIGELADFCKSQNSQFDRERWLAYIAGECGPNGGTVKKG